MSSQPLECRTPQCLATPMLSGFFILSTTSRRMVREFGRHFGLPLPVHRPPSVCPTNGSITRPICSHRSCLQFRLHTEKQLQTAPVAARQRRDGDTGGAARSHRGLRAASCHHHAEERKALGAGTTWVWKKVAEDVVRRSGSPAKGP